MRTICVADNIVQVPSPGLGQPPVEMAGTNGVAALVGGYQKPPPPQLGEVGPLQHGLELVLGFRVRVRFRVSRVRDRVRVRI